MRLNREQFFDLVELVGKAVVTARKKPADGSWLDEMIPYWLCERRPKPREDEFGLFEGTSWSDCHDDSERTDLAAVAPGAEGFSLSPWEKGKAERAKREFGDHVSTELWTIQRKVALGGIGVMEGLTQLMELCRRLAKWFISEGWANQLVRILDRASH